MTGPITINPMDLGNFPAQFVAAGQASGNLILGNSAPKLFNGVQIAAAASTIDVVGGVPLAGATGAVSTSGNLGAYLDIEAISADGTTILVGGNLMGIGGRGNNLYTRLINPSLPVRQAIAGDGSGAGIWCSPNNYVITTNADGSRDHYALFAVSYDTTAARYNIAAVGLSGFATRAMAELIALNLLGVLPAPNTAGSVLTGTGIAVKLHDNAPVDNVFDTYQVVCGTGGAVTMASPAPMPARPTTARLFSIGLSSVHGVAAPASTIDVVGGVPLASRYGRDFRAQGVAWGALDTEVVSLDGTTLLNTADNLVSLGGRGNNLASRFYNPTLCIRQALVADGSGRGIFNCVNGNNWVNQLTTLPFQQYAMDTTGTDATYGRSIEIVAGLSGFGTRASAQALADGVVSRDGCDGIVVQMTDTNGDNRFETITKIDTTCAVAYEFYDFMNVPWAEFWDYRTATYGDRPVNAECFNQTAINNGVCTPVDPNVPNVPTYPYVQWYPTPGTFNPILATTNSQLYAPYRMKVRGNDQSGYNLSEPVFLPILNYGEAPGTRLEFDWRWQYLNTSTTDAYFDRSCLAFNHLGIDGFQSHAQLVLTMDLQQSRRMFGVVATDAASAQSWWNNPLNTDPLCFRKPPGGVEAKVDSWFATLGGGATTMGKYDIFNSYEWYYQTFFTNITARVAPDGTTTVNIDMAHWGTEVLFGRWFFWGNTSYKDHWDDSTKARGWWGMEYSWMEDMVFKGSLGLNDFDFTLDAVVQYHLQEWSKPGPNGVYNRPPPAGDDVPYWYWGAVLTDYTLETDEKGSSAHTVSELHRYDGVTYLHTTPGSQFYDRQRRYDYTPHTWNLKTGDKWTFMLGTGTWAFHDPNLTPIGANPIKGEYVQSNRVPVLTGTFPFAFGTYDSLARIFTVRGPLNTGGPLGAPGNYPLEPYPRIDFH